MNENALDVLKKDIGLTDEAKYLESNLLKLLNTDLSNRFEIFNILEEIHDRKIYKLRYGNFLDYLHKMGICEVLECQQTVIKERLSFRKILREYKMDIKLDRFWARYKRGIYAGLEKKDCLRIVTGDLTFENKYSGSVGHKISNELNIKKNHKEFSTDENTVYTISFMIEKEDRKCFEENIFDFIDEYGYCSNFKKSNLML